MPIHDWTRVAAGIWHNFHYRWISAITDALNDGRMPPDYFAMAEQKVEGPEPDVVTLSVRDDGTFTGGGLATLAKPKTSIVQTADAVCYARKANRVGIHHGLGTVVALVELVSPGNKDTKRSLRAFARKTAAFIRNGIHVLVVDVFPPGKHDPNGVHPAVWENITTADFALPADKPLTLVGYQAGECPTAYIEPVAVGATLPDMPLYLTEEYHVPVPLEATYEATWAVMPQPIRELL